MVTFVEWIFWLQDMGLADVLIPFFLVFAIVFAVMQKTKILGKEAKKFNVILALAMAFAVVVPHVMWGTPDPTDHYLVTGVVDIVEVINGSLPQVAVTVLAIVMLMLILGVFGKTWDPKETGGGVVVMVSLLIIVYIFGTNAGWFYGGVFPPWLWWLSSPETQALLLTLLVFGVVVWLITKEDKPRDNRGKFFKELFNMEDLGDD